MIIHQKDIQRIGGMGLSGKSGTSTDFVSIIEETSMAFDPILRWKKSPSLDVSKYSVSWTRNGVAAGAGDVIKNISLDSIGYSVKFSQHNPTIVVGDGDVITGTIRSVDGSGLASEITEKAITLPSEPPAPPTDVTLSLS